MKYIIYIHEFIYTSASTYASPIGLLVWLVRSAWRRRQAAKCIPSHMHIIRRMEVVPHWSGHESWFDNARRERLGKRCTNYSCVWRANIGVLCKSIGDEFNVCVCGGAFCKTDTDLIYSIPSADGFAASCNEAHQSSGIRYGYFIPVMRWWRYMWLPGWALVAAGGGAGYSVG